MPGGNYSLTGVGLVLGGRDCSLSDVHWRDQSLTVWDAALAERDPVLAGAELVAGWAGLVLSRAERVAGTVELVLGERNCSLAVRAWQLAG